MACKHLADWLYTRLPRPLTPLLTCSFFISGGDDIEFEISLNGVRQRELCGGGASNNREDTYQTTLFVPEDKAPGMDLHITMVLIMPFQQQYLTCTSTPEQLADRLVGLPQRCLASTSSTTRCPA